MEDFPFSDNKDTNLFSMPADAFGSFDPGESN